MQRIIFIETSTELCSTALSEDGRLVAYKESGEPRVHASMTAVFIDEMLRERGLTVGDCSAVCVCSGPGSYTGLRVGVSTAKGLCFGANLPLISVGTLEVLVWQYLSEQFSRDPFTGNPISQAVPSKTPLSENENSDREPRSTSENNNGAEYKKGSYTYKYIIPLVDARRMEAYTAIYRADGTAITEPEAKIVDAESFAEQLNEGAVLFIGDAAEKCSTVITHPNAHFIQCRPKASSMLIPAVRAYEAGRFEDVAYFEPAYLKEFKTTVSKKSLW